MNSNELINEDQSRGHSQDRVHRMEIIGEEDEIDVGPPKVAVNQIGPVTHTPNFPGQRSKLPGWERPDLFVATKQMDGISLGGTEIGDQPKQLNTAEIRK